MPHLLIDIDRLKYEKEKSKKMYLLIRKLAAGTQTIRFSII